MEHRKEFESALTSREKGIKETNDESVSDNNITHDINLLPCWSYEVVDYNILIQNKFRLYFTFN